MWLIVRLRGSKSVRPGGEGVPRKHPDGVSHPRNRPTSLLYNKVRCWLRFVLWVRNPQTAPPPCVGISVGREKLLVFLSGAPLSGRSPQYAAFRELCGQSAWVIITMWPREVSAWHLFERRWGLRGDRWALVDCNRSRSGPGCTETEAASSNQRITIAKSSLCCARLVYSWQPSWIRWRTYRFLLHVCLYFRIDMFLYASWRWRQASLPGGYPQQGSAYVEDGRPASLLFSFAWLSSGWWVVSKRRPTRSIEKLFACHV